jgi:hypothetical protein
MKFASLISLVLACLVSAAAMASEQYLEIKGFHVGMKAWELKAHQTDFCYVEGCTFSNKVPFTVGGIKGRFLTASYNDSAEVDSVDFTFDSLEFEHLRTALLEKYPRAKCADSEVITRRGLRVPQVVCGFETPSDGIYLVRVAGNINRSMMVLMSAEKKQEMREHIAAANKDL